MVVMTTMVHETCRCRVRRGGRQVEIVIARDLRGEQGQWRWIHADFKVILTHHQRRRRCRRPANPEPRLTQRSVQSRVLISVKCSETRRLTSALRRPLVLIPFIRCSMPAFVHFNSVLLVLLLVLVHLFEDALVLELKSGDLVLSLLDLELEHLNGFVGHSRRVAHRASCRAWGVASGPRGS